MSIFLTVLCSNSVYYFLEVKFVYRTENTASQEYNSLNVHIHCSNVKVYRVSMSERQMVAACKTHGWRRYLSYEKCILWVFPFWLSNAVLNKLQLRNQTRSFLLLLNRDQLRWIRVVWICGPAERGSHPRMESDFQRRNEMSQVLPASVRRQPSEPIELRQRKNSSGKQK